MFLVEVYILFGFALVAAIWYKMLPHSSGKFIKHFIKKKRIPLSGMWAALLILQLIYKPFLIPEAFHVAATGMGLVFYTVGIGFAIWGRLSMGNLWGVPVQHDVKRQNKLVTHGAFQYSRNPIYTGLFIMFIGLELALQSYLVLLAIPLYIFLLHIIQDEEKNMQKYFKGEWKEYSLRVRRFL